MEFEDILVEVGDYGNYQKYLIIIFLVPAASLLPWFSMNIFFMVAVPEHWCYVPEVVMSNLTIAQQRALISPSTNPGCTMYDVNYTQLLESGMYNVTTNETIKCNQGWSYDTTNYDATAASKWDMVCDDYHYTSLVLTLYNVGSIIGTPIYGSLSDKIGRKPTFYIAIVVTAVTALSSVLMTNFTAFVVLRTINGSLMPSVFQLPYIIILEIVSPEMRTRMNGVTNLSWVFGMCWLPLIAYLTHNWITLGLVTSSVTVLFFLYWKFLPESPRWLVSQERYKEALTIMSKIADKNGKKQDPELLMMKLQKLGERIKKEKDVDGVQNSPMDLLRYPQLRKKFLIITFCWIADITAYYGLQINVPNLGGNEFINFFLLALVEAPGYLASWWFMEHLGRRWCTVAGFLMTGAACMLPAILPPYLPYVDVICSLVGKFCAAATFMATYQQSSELYPTTVRSLGMGMSSTLAFVVTLAVPYLIYLGVYGKFIPFLIIGFTCFLAGIFAAFLPETLNENLPQTIFDAEDFGKHQVFFSCNRRRRASCHEIADIDKKAIADVIKAAANQNDAKNGGGDVGANKRSSVQSNLSLVYRNVNSADVREKDVKRDRSVSNAPSVVDALATDAPVEMKNL